MNPTQQAIDRLEKVNKTLEMAMRTALSMLFSLVFLIFTFALFSYKLEHPINLSVGIFYVSVFYASIGFALLLNYLFEVRIGAGIVFAEGIIFTAFFNINAGIFMSLLALAIFTLWNKAKRYPVYIPCCIMGIVMISVLLLQALGVASNVPLQNLKFMYTVLFGDIGSLEP